MENNFLVWRNKDEKNQDIRFQDIIPITVNDEENHRKKQTNYTPNQQMWGLKPWLEKIPKNKAKKYGYVTTFMLVHFPQTWSYPRNLVPGGPSCKMRLTRLSPSFRGGGAVGRWSLLIHTQQKRRGRRKVMSTPGNLVTTVTRSKAQRQIQIHTPKTVLQWVPLQWCDQPGPHLPPSEAWRPDGASSPVCMSPVWVRNTFLAALWFAGRCDGNRA